MGRIVWRPVCTVNKNAEESYYIIYKLPLKLIDYKQNLIKMPLKMPDASITHPAKFIVYKSIYNMATNQLTPNIASRHKIGFTPPFILSTVR